MIVIIQALVCSAIIFYLYYTKQEKHMFSACSLLFLLTISEINVHSEFFKMIFIIYIVFVMFYVGCLKAKLKKGDK